MDRDTGSRWIGLATLVAGLLAVAATAAGPDEYRVRTLRRAIVDLTDSFGDRYPHGREYLERLGVVEAMPAAERGPALANLQREALLANPLLDFGRLLLVKRRLPAGASGKSAYRDLGIPGNGSSNSEFREHRYDNEIAALPAGHFDAPLATVYRPPEGGYAGELELHWSAQRLLFSQSGTGCFQVWEMHADGAGAHQVSQLPDDVDCYDACYLPDGRIVFGCTASYQSVPCFHGIMPACHLYRMDADGSHVRQLCFDQDLDVHATALNNGQVMYNRWDYTGINHIFLRELMVMNPDGTGQRAIYGSNSWFPNSLYFSRAIPGSETKLVSILSGYHGAPRMGWLVIVDTSRGWYEADGLVTRISGKGDPIRPVIRDRLVDRDWPKFLHPYPLSDPRAAGDQAGPGAGKYFLTACQPAPERPWGIYLADVFDNLLLLREAPGFALLEPVPLIPRALPPALPERLDLERDDAAVYLHNVYAGPGLAGVPRGTVKRLRVLAYHFGYRGLAGPDKVGYGGPWEVMRILGTVPIEDDGSAFFRVPARTPLAVQPLDAEGRAIQLMRSWFTAMPGEVLSCVGCHEAPNETAPALPAAAARRGPRELTPWHGPARGFGFVREVQPMLDRYCVSCHDGRDGRPDLRSVEQAGTTANWPMAYPERRHRDMKKQNWQPHFSPAYDALIRQVRRVGIEDDVSLLTPGEYQVDTSPLIQLLKRGHHGVALPADAWDRLYTWIDLNAPYHGSWSDVFPIPDSGGARRRDLQLRYGGPEADPETALMPPPAPGAPIVPRSPPRPAPVNIEGWPLEAGAAARRQAALGRHSVEVDLGGQCRLRLVRLPDGSFVMGDRAGPPDEWPPRAVRVEHSFWIGAFEVTNAQFRRFDPTFDCRYYIKRYPRTDGQGAPLNGPDQPAVRVSWQQADAFCRWLSERTGVAFTLPTETQWEYACRAGSAEAFAFGALTVDFSAYANLADRAFSKGLMGNGKQSTGGLPHHVLEGADLADKDVDDGAVVTTAVGRYRPNAWGLYDMHGNAAEWTRSDYVAGDGPALRTPATAARKVVRGGSFFDPPRRSRCASRLAYPVWRRVFNVGFRVVCEADALPDGVLVDARASER